MCHVISRCLRVSRYFSLFACVTLFLAVCLCHVISRCLRVSRYLSLFACVTLFLAVCLCHVISRCLHVSRYLSLFACVTLSLVVCISILHNVWFSAILLTAGLHLLLSCEFQNRWYVDIVIKNTPSGHEGSKIYQETAFTLRNYCWLSHFIVWCRKEVVRRVRKYGDRLG
jgi:hypothetical protein